MNPLTHKAADGGDMIDVDSPDYNDTNLGDPRETPEEKEIARLERKFRTACEERDRYKADSERWRNTAFYMLNVEYEERKRLLDSAVSHDK